MSAFTHDDLSRVMRQIQRSPNPNTARLTPELLERVVDALEKPAYRWRTVRGVANETGLEEDVVLEVLANLQDWVIRSSIPSPNGEDLYTTREHFKKSGSLWERIRGVLLNRAT